MSLASLGSLASDEETPRQQCHDRRVVRIAATELGGLLLQEFGDLEAAEIDDGLRIFCTPLVPS